VETSNGRSGLFIAVWLQVKVRERGLRLHSLACSFCDTKVPLQLRYVELYKCKMPYEVACHFCSYIMSVMRDILSILLYCLPNYQPMAIEPSRLLPPRSARQCCFSIILRHCHRLASPQYFLLSSDIFLVDNPVSSSEITYSVWRDVKPYSLNWQISSRDYSGH